jgi:hypothetical protein
MLQLGYDWMHYPDLKKLNDDYVKNHDPITFLRGLATSPSFPKLVMKYADDPGIREFCIEFSKRASSAGVMGVGLQWANKENVVQRLLDNTVQALGLPAGLFSDPSKINEKSIMGSISNNPDIQKAMADPAVQQQMQSPAAQAALDNSAAARKTILPPKEDGK